MNIDWWTLGLQSINALILIWLLSRFLFTPVAQLIAIRQRAANELLDDAETTRSLVNQDRLKSQQALLQLAQQRENAVELATAEAAEHKNTLMAKAAIEAEKLIDQSRVEISRHQQRLDVEARTHATQLALEIAEKMMDRLPAVSRVAGFTDGLIKSLKELSEADKRSFFEDKNTLQLRVAYPMTDQERTHCLSAIERELGHELLISVSVDPALIAGIELVGTHCAVRNSFRTDLTYLATTLELDDVAN